MPRIQIQTARREADTTEIDPLVVGFLDEDFTCRNKINQFVFMEMVTTEIGDGTSPSEIVMVANAFMTFLQDIIIPEDWDRFRKVCRANSVGTDDLQPLIQGIVEYYGAHPTQRPSDSSDGPPITGSSSRAGSSPMAAYRAS